MLAYALRRFLIALPLLLGVAALNFVLINLAPGDPVLYLLGEGEGADPGLAARLRAELGLDRPLPERFLLYLKGLLQGHLGYSLAQGRPVAEAIAERLPATLLLAASALAVAAGLGIPLGVYLAQLSLQKPRMEQGFFFLVLLATNLPPFVLGLLLILVFSLWLGFFPSQGIGSVRGGGGFGELLAHLALPALTLGLQPLASLARVTRARVVEVLQEEFVRAARAKGLPERAVLYKHALRNAFPAPLSLLALSAGHWAGGAAVTETVFAWPGLGRLGVEATLARDYPLLVGSLLVATLGVILANLVADLALALLDPRVRYG